jgi:hypothetical protein
VSWSCSASAVKAQVAGGDILNPINANRDAPPCNESVVGLPNVGESLSLQDLIVARTGYAATLIKPERPMNQTPNSLAGIEQLEIVPDSGPAIGVGAARSQVAAKCTNGAPAYVGASEVASITLGGTPIVLDGVLQPITDALSDALGVIISVRLNEQVKLEGGGIAQRAAHIILLSAAGANPLADVIVAESRVGQSGAVCDPNAEGNAPTTGGGTTTTTPPSSGTAGETQSGGQPCPPGSVFDVRRNVCVIPVPGSQTADNPLGDITGPGSVIIGRPYEGPTGGSVMTLTEARQKYKSPCLSGPGVPWVVLGTTGNDRITGGNRSERILSFAGRDRVDGGRGHDCMDGGRDRDVMTGGQGNDRGFGQHGNDSLNGDIGNDYLSGGIGNDTIVLAYGADRAFGGAGNDIINAGVAGKRQRISCGTGYDVVRRQSYDRSVGCESVRFTRS